MMMRPRTSSSLLAAWVAGVMCVSAAPSAQAKVKLKLATLAPADSAWMKLFEGMNRELKQATGARTSSVSTLVLLKGLPNRSQACGR